MDVKKQIKILLIEDKLDDVKLVRKLLFRDCPGKFELVSASCMKEAIEYLNDQEFDIVLSDLMLPDSEGTETIHRIQDNNTDIPIVVLSAHDNEEIAMKIVQSGVQDYLVKGQGDGHLIGRSMQYAIERKRIQLRLNQLALYDNLTGLANRSLFRDRLSQAMVRADRNQKLVALMYIDLDDFKQINDTLGHDAGDKLLVEIAGRFEKCVRKSDTVARLGGDEFTIILENIKEVNDAIIVADKILKDIKQPANIENNKINISLSIGITFYPTDTTSITEMLKYADKAMYKAKNARKSNYHFYNANKDLDISGTIK